MHTYYSLSPRSQELTFNKTSEEMQPAHEDKLAQTFGTEGAETIGGKLAESNGIANKYEVEKEKSTHDTDSKVSEVTQASSPNMSQIVLILNYIINPLLILHTDHSL